MKFEQQESEAVVLEFQRASDSWGKHLPLESLSEAENLHSKEVFQESSETKPLSTSDINSRIL